MLTSEPKSNILLVDDRLENLISLGAVLDLPEYNLVKVASGREALKAVLTTDFAVILLDVQMPIMDGFETAALIKKREKSRDIPIIFITAVSKDEAFMFKGYGSGAVDYIVKPFEPAVLRSKVAVFADLHRKNYRIQEQEKLLREAERKQAETRIKQNELLKAAMVDASLDCIISINEDGEIIEFNPAAEKTFGYKRSQVLGRSMADLIIPTELRDQHRERFSLYLKTRTARILRKPIEMSALRSNGEIFPTELTVTEVRMEGSTIFTAFLRDITDRKKIEQERENLLTGLREAIQSRDEFLSIAAHELRTPLTALQLQLELVLRILKKNPSGGNDFKFPQNVSVALQQTDRLDKLVDTLLDVSRIRMRKLSLDREEFDLAELARKVVERFQAEAIAAGCTLSLEADASVWGKWDRLRIEQVITNLISNAIKYGARKPIKLKVDSLDQKAVFSIQDQGIGIAPDNLKRIFGRFERAVSTRNYGGLGLGLYITREIVSVHGGEIQIESEIGKGSTFRVQLPFFSKEAEVPHGESEKPVEWTPQSSSLSSSKGKKTLALVP